jgi:hypothetical protein
MKPMTIVIAATLACWLATPGHAWSVGPAEALARTIKAALDKTKHQPPPP